MWVGDEMTDGTRSIRIEADALDAAAFGATIGQIADALGALGDDDLADVRAKAVGVIADPQGTLDLLGGPGTQADPEENPGALGTARTASRRRGGRARVVLYVHLHADALRSHGAPATEAGRGRGGRPGRGSRGGHRAADPGLGRRTDVTITPVLDLDDRASVDAYEVPDRMRETVLLRSPCCPFPGATTSLAARTSTTSALPAAQCRRTTGADHPGQPRPAVPATSPAEDPRRLELHPTRTRHLPVALTPRPPLPRRPHRHRTLDHTA